MHKCLHPEGTAKGTQPRTKKGTNRQARHPRRSPTLPRQLRPRPKKAKAKQRDQLRPPARTRPNEQANQPEPNPDSTHSNLGRDPSRPWRECGSWTRQQAGTRTNQNGQERTRTNKRQQGLVEYQGKPRSKAPPSPSDQGHREQGSGKLLGSRREGRAPPSPSDLARLQQGHREQGSGQPASL